MIVVSAIRLAVFAQFRDQSVVYLQESCTFIPCPTNPAAHISPVNIPRPVKLTASRERQNRHADILVLNRERYWNRLRLFTDPPGPLHRLPPAVTA